MILSELVVAEVSIKVTVRLVASKAILLIMSVTPFLSTVNSLAIGVTLLLRPEPNSFRANVKLLPITEAVLSAGAVVSKVIASALEDEDTKLAAFVSVAVKE